MEQRCRKCNRVLTTDESRARGYGPVCDGDHIWVDLDEIIRPKRKTLMERCRSGLRRILPWHGTR